MATSTEIVFDTSYRVTLDGVQVSLTPQGTRGPGVPSTRGIFRGESATTTFTVPVEGVEDLGAILFTLMSREVAARTRARFLATRDALRARLTARRPVENPLPLDGPARCAWRPAVTATCETRTVRCKARRHGLLAVIARKPGRVVACRTAR